MSQASTAFTSQTKIPHKNMQITEKVNDLNSLMEDILSEYKTHGDVVKTHSSLKHIERSIQLLFDDMTAYKLDEDEIELLTAICRKMNEDAHIQDVRYYYIEERYTEEEIIQLPSIDNYKLSNFTRKNFPMESARKKAGVVETTHEINKNQEEMLSLIKNLKEDLADFKLDEANNVHVNEGSNAAKMTHKSEVAPEAHKQAEIVQEEEKAVPKPVVVETTHEIKKNQEEVLSMIKNLKEELADLKLDEGSHAIKVKEVEIHRSEVAPVVRKQVVMDPEIKKNEEEILSLVKHMKEEFANFKLDEAYNVYVKLRDFSKTRKLHIDDTIFLQKKLQENKKIVDDIETHYQNAQLILNELQDEEGYTLESVKKNFSVKYKTGEGGLVSLKMEGVLDVPLFNMLALIYEMDCYNQWMPFTKDSKEIKQMTTTSKAGWLKWNLPPPISNREAYVYGVGFNRLEVNGSVLIVAKSIHNDPEFARKLGIDIPTQSKLSRIDLHYMGGAFFPISKEKIRVSLVTKFDPKIKLLPTSLVSWFVRKAAQFLFDILIKKATNFKGSVWEQRIQQNRGFYGWLEEEINKYLNAQEANQQQAK